MEAVPPGHPRPAPPGKTNPIEEEEKEDVHPAHRRRACSRLTLSTAFAAPPPEVVELEGQWRGRLCTAEGNPTKTNLSIDKYGCFVLFQTDVNGAAQSAGTVTVKEGVMTLVDAKTGPYMVLKVSDDGRLVQDVRGKLPKNCCYLKRR